MQKIKYTWADLDRDIQILALEIALSGWMPDYIVGVVRGGCVPAVMLSHLLRVPMWALKVSLRDNIDCESNGWMAENAFGYGIDQPKNILVVDDINDSGATFQWIQQDWTASCLPNDPLWATIWGNSVKFAVLHHNEGSRFKNTDYAANWINKSEQDIWIVYPWESLSSDK